jgi:sugar/nucleoside kinase (ribokinase family)
MFDRASIVGVSAQGWLRALDDEGHVVRSSWSGPPFWRGASAVFVSDEDLPNGRADAEAWCAEVSIVAMTESRKGLQLWSDGRWRRMEAFPEDELDPTGAGDTFASAFLIRLSETQDVDEAAWFGAAAASLAVRGVGAEAQPAREEIIERMRAYPEVKLR